MAGGRIKGITIEFDGNTTKLQKSLSGLDKSLKTSQNNLKDINKLLKLDPKNTELLTQKQKNLKKAIGETKERLDKLKGAQSQVKEGTDEWDSLQREIIATEQDLKGLEDEHKEFGSVANQKIKAVGDSIKELGSKISEVGDKISGFGTNVTTHVTAPIAAVGGASIAAFKSVDTGMDTIIKKTGATGETAEEMRGILERLATSIPTDFETAGAAIGEVNTRFGVTGDELEELSAKFIKFADLNDTDVSSSIDSVQAAMAAFNLDSSEAGNVLDMLNKAGQDTGVSLDTLTGQLLTNSASFDELGMDINQSIGFLSQLEKNGLDTSTVLGGMKKALQNATKEGKPMNEALAELQEKMQNAGSDTEAAQEVMELFGNKAGPAIAKAVDEGKISLTDFGGGVTEFGDSVNTTFESTLDPMDQFTTTLNELKITGAEVGGSLLEVLSPAIEKVSEVIGLLKEKWDSLSPETQDTIIKAALIAAAIGPVIVVIGSVISGIGSIVTGIGGLIGAMGLLFSPIGLIVAAIAGVIAIGVALYQNWDKICEWANNLKTRITEAWTNIKQNISEKVTAIKEAISSKFDAAKDKVLGVFTAIKSGITEKLGAARDFIKRVIDRIKGFFDFDWSLPDIKLPHFSIEGSFSLKPPSIPHISVEWYKKAYDNPYLFTSPTIIDGMGVGDGGRKGEFMYGYDSLMRDIAKAKGGDTININVYASEGMNVNQLATQIQKRLTFVQNQKARAYV